MRHPRLALAASMVVIGAVLAAGYLAAGTTGLVDAAAVAVIGVLLVARSTVRGEKPRSVRLKKWLDPRRRPAVRTADFPAYRRIFSDLEWAQMSRRHYEHALRPMLARLAATLDHGRPIPAELTRPASPDVDGPGVDPATLERIVATLEDRTR
jgi:hypothetical protein